MTCDLVIANFEDGRKNYLFHAPYTSGLKAGDWVEVEGGSGFAKVYKVMTIDCQFPVDRERYNFITSMAGVKLPLKKIRAKLVKTEFYYADECGLTKEREDDE